MIPTAQASKWFQCPCPKPRAKVRLFCFHYAGGGASAYNHWGRDLPDTIEVVAIQLPGREARMFEPVFTSLKPLLAALSDEILPCLDMPFAFFGHSMGAIVSFELARLLQTQYNKIPVHLFVSGYPAPHTYKNETPYYTQPDDKLIESIKKLGGTPQEILANEELMRLVLPTIRADFQVCDTYEFEDGEILECPLTAFGGSQDEMLTEAGMQAWEELTRAEFELKMFEGDHFYLLEPGNRDRLFKSIEASLY
jgi:medium-chain acyl-[acyl-carrier-protein] hydrolase